MIKFFVLISLIFACASQKWHTSQIALSKLYDLQKEHFDVFNNYLDLETKRLEQLKSDLDVMYKWMQFINDTYLHNHITALKVMKQIYNQIRKVEDLMNSEQSFEALKMIDSNKDLSGDHINIAHQALRRLQRFYMISASEMAAGRYKNRNIGDQMNICDCYAISKYCFEKQEMYCVLEWAIEAYKKWKNHDQPKCVDIKNLYLYIISSSVYTGFDFRLILNPSELRQNLSEITKKYEQFFILGHKNMNLLNNETIMNVFGTYESDYHFQSRDKVDRFRNLCEYGVPVRILTNYSKCRYQTNNSPYRILMPFKEEDINSYPYIKLYHDVLYDEEILDLKNFASANMRDALVKSSDTSIFVEADRSGQVNWFYESKKSLDSRIESFTGFSTKGAESYQIVNYGLGGHYIPHNDPLDDQRDRQLGDRMMTVLFYMNDVQNDGYTVFPILDIIVPAEKGAALVWLNLNMSDGSKIYETLHGSCPLLKGNKWIMTRWLLEEEQQRTYDWRKNL